ncbi:bifunctional diaminohydroxyphosphoribosylaminopyrimidine deaminase/5-amino-6-(5-phosphoribosylamino)uracil reductase RibD [Pseudoalteromonas denitrificans]|uniref:Riboflavin biosynthesis protein RibD n=1 Tax=Pseudoalteromonas denitrificans DSM 6059 TaxID=1123010 RepID=A0A1I1E1U4_9GAMM|nr:bifunctional diaminohydroxyphosphoribosylaminopyrimidine deaminase/5-amino-6-(5-phosphoribosylamino)uracil reductase RibD [Pseudoalteromonas denitrificans]SFB80646.1 diaminohydroxyphosphoribosylaminopyrimidine deaminase [Pseudoalteromonas denitrificans DSM 6059]
MQFTQEDRVYMARAIELAKKGRYTTTPNPNVGCVLVKSGEIVGEGFHQKAGQSHAEVNAIAMAGEKAKGATAYVTLEPCSHFGLTPPCAEGLKKAGIIKVISAMVDPNPKVSGKGLAILNEAGVETAHGLLEKEAIDLNPGFLTRMKTGKPFVTCKLASSLDGKTALKNGQSKWITGSKARQDVQNLRAQNCAILTGADTVILDNAKMNVRYEELMKTEFTELNLNSDQLRQPIRIVIDSQNRLTPDLEFFKISSPIIILTTKLDKSSQWPHFVTQMLVPERDGKIDLSVALTKLASHNINNLFLEAGHTLSGKFSELDLVDQYIFYIAPKLMGDCSKGLVNLPEFTNMMQVNELTFLEVTMIGEDIRIIASPKKTN